MRDTLLLACGSQSNRKHLCSVFEGSYNILEAATGKQAYLLLEQNSDCIAAILLDLTVQNKGGHSLLDQYAENKQFSSIPLLVFLNERTCIDEVTAFSMGAMEVIAFPCDPLVLQSRVQTIVTLNRHQWHLQELLSEQTEILRHSNEVMVDALSSIIEYRSVESGQHILRIRRFTKLLLDEVARACPEYNLDRGAIDIISSASALHDVGKISIPDSVLNKPDRLTEEEWEIMRSHTTTGCRILESLSGMSNEDYLRYAHNICHYHHERWDGKGYPEGIAGDDIPICAQVVGLADAYDALTSDRVYKKAYPFDRAANMILNGECGLFSPKLLDCFKQVSAQMAALAKAYADGRSPKSDSISIPLPGPAAPSGSDTLHMTQMRYHALLHHINATVIEADLDQNLFHVVYNPDPLLSFFKSSHDFSETSATLLELVVPEDREHLRRLYREDIPHFLDSGMRRQSAVIRLREAGGALLRYRLTLLRLNLADPATHRLLILWENIHSDAASVQTAMPVWRNDLSGENVFSSIACFAQISNDRHLTLAQVGPNFSAMLGYTTEELHNLFHNRLSELIHPEDLQRVLRTVTQQLTHAPSVEIEYRLLHRDGHAVWVMHKGSLFRTAAEAELIYSLFIDISHSMAAQKHMVDTLDRYQTIFAQAQNVIFEWEIATDAVRYFGDFEGIFGYTPMSTGFTDQLDTNSHLHPDDIAVFQGLLESLRQGADYQVAEVRLATAAGRYLWCRFRLTTKFDSAGRPWKAVGLITNIDSEKRSSLQLQSQSERDSLTKLLNKEAGRSYAEAALSPRTAGLQAALLIIDLDNFKQVNDRHGHMFGDAVISQTAGHLRKFFRSDDIVARVGGDEFMVLIKGQSTPALISERCRRVTEGLKALLLSLAPDCALSCSIGIACCPEHGTSYQDLYHRADQALYDAKALGKNRFCFYQQRSSKLVSAINSHIDSNDHTALAENSLVQYAFQRLYESSDVEETIDYILGSIGREMNVSRVYVFENSPDNKLCSNTFEWCNDGISPEIQNLQNISYDDDIPGYRSAYNEHGLIYCTNIADLPPDLYQILAPQGIVSMLHCAIRDNGVFRGYVGFDDCTAQRLWTQEQIDALVFFSEIISVFLLKKRAQDEIARHASELTSILDNQNAYIYVIDPDDLTLKFLNSKTRQLAPNAAVGMKCHKCLMGLDERCPNCPAADIRSKKNFSRQIENLYLSKTVQADASLIRWRGQDACLLNCREIGQ